MMLMAKAPAKLSARILDEASTWFTELHGDALDPAAQAEFNAWLRRSPEHVQAYLQIAALWEDADMLASRLGADFEDLIARARQEQNVYPLEWARESAPTSRAAEVPTKQPVGSGHRGLLPIAASVAALLVTAASWLYLQRGVYSTDIGEQRSITLEDGSSVELNARSRLKVHFTERQRSVELIAGQALFRVAKDPARVFVVQSGDARVRAVGTEFDVYRKRSGTIVTVVEGRVAATSEHDAEVLLQAGEQLMVSAVAPAAPKLVDTAMATAWTEKKLAFDGTPLREAVEEFNRYNRRQLVIRDPSLYEFHVSGVFPSTDSARMIDVLRRRFAVTAIESGDRIEIVRRTDDSGVDSNVIESQ